MKKSKLTIEKFKILELTDSSNIKGGTYTTITEDDYTTALNSENTTFTTDPNVVCPDTILSNTMPYTIDPQNGHGGVPTFNVTINPGP